MSGDLKMLQPDPTHSRLKSKPLGFIWENVPWVYSLESFHLPGVIYYPRVYCFTAHCFCPKQLCEADDSDSYFSLISTKYSNRMCLLDQILVNVSKYPLTFGGIYLMLLFWVRESSMVAECLPNIWYSLSWISSIEKNKCCCFKKQVWWNFNQYYKAKYAIWALWV